MNVWMPTIRTGTGAQVYAERLAEGLRSRGHSVTLDLLHPFFQYAPWLVPLLSRARAPHNCDLVFANSWSASAFRRRGLPLVTVVHHVVHNPALRRYKTLAQRAFHAAFVRPMERGAMARSAAVIAVSETTAHDARAFLGDSAIVTVLNAVDTEFFTPARESAARDPQRPLALLFVGKPSRRKGFDIVARFARHLGQRARLTLVGPEGEPGLPPVDAQRLGRLTDMQLRDAYRHADFLLLPSRMEGFGYVAAEAMACGLPVLCLKGGAVEEIASPPLGGLTIDPDALEGSAAAVLDLTADPQQLDRMRESARALAVERYGIARWLDEMEAVLASAIQPRR